MMDRALKERIVGAVVLVVFVVLVVPIFLDGPPDGAPIVSEPVLLPGQEAQDTKVVVLDRERSVPIPAARQPTQSPMPVEEDAGNAPVDDSAATRDATPKPIVAEPTPRTATTTATPAETSASDDKPAREEPPVATPPESSETGMWAVQLGSFSNKDNAEALAANLRKQGYAAFLSRTASGGKELHRVRIGPQKDRDGAEAMATRLAKVGHKGQVLPHP